MSPDQSTYGNQTSSSMNDSSQLGQQAKDATNQVADKAKDAASNVMQQAQDTARTTAHQQKNRAADSMDTVAQALRKTSEHLNQQDQAGLGNFVEQAASRLEQFSDDLQNKSVDEMLNDVQDFARRDPQLFLGGAVVLGLLAARFFKSSGQRQQYQGQRYGGQYGSQYAGGQYYGTSRGYNRQDLADYRRDALNNEYTGTYRGEGSTTSEPYRTGSEDFTEETEDFGGETGTTAGTDMGRQSMGGQSSSDFGTQGHTNYPSPNRPTTRGTGE